MGRDVRPWIFQPSRSYFNPLAPRGARRCQSAVASIFMVFQSTRPVRGETAAGMVMDVDFPFQSTRPVRGETFSIADLHQVATDFNPLAPCGARPSCSLTSMDSRKFQSTRPVRGETRHRGQKVFFNGISIHSPRAGRDICRPVYDIVLLLFQSTRPVRGETLLRMSKAGEWRISIHSPRAGRDWCARSSGRSIRYFNPLAPCGARRITRSFRIPTAYFNPLAPCAP